MKRSITSLLLVAALLLTFIVSPASTVSASGSETGSIVLDFSFFDAQPGSDAYSDGANKFFSDVGDLISDVESAYFVDMDKYEASAIALQYPKISDLLDQDKNYNALSDYLDKDDRASSIYTDVERLYKFEEDYKKIFDSSIKGKIDDLLEEADGMNKSELIEALETYNTAVRICDCVLLNLPDFQPAKDKKAEAQQRIQKLMGSVDKSFYSSDVHKNNLGKVLFSTNNIVAGKETQSQFTGNFTASSNIYAIAYLPMRVKTIAPNGTKFDGTYIAYETIEAEAALSVDGEISYAPVTVPMNIKDYQANKGYLTFEIIPNPKSTVGYNQYGWYQNLFKRLKPGKHHVSIVLTIDNAKVATGSFDIDWTNANLSNIEKNAEKCDAIASDYRANLRKVPTQFSQKHNPYKDALLTDAKIKALIKSEYKDCKKVTKFINIGESKTPWYIEKNDLGIPIARYSTNETWAIYSSTDGWSYIIEVKVKCDYKGGGTYGKPYLKVIMSAAKIATKNVK